MAVLRYRGGERKTCYPNKTCDEGSICHEDNRCVPIRDGGVGGNVYSEYEKVARFSCSNCGEGITIDPNDEMENGRIAEFMENHRDCEAVETSPKN